MKEIEKYRDLERKIRSFPEPDYETKFPKATQDRIHENLLQFAQSYEKKNIRGVKMKKFSIGLASVAAFMLVAILLIPMTDDLISGFISIEQGKQINEQSPIGENNGNNGDNGENENNEDNDKEAIGDNDKETNNQTDSENEIPDTILYENHEYGFTFALPKSWEGYQIVAGSWEGISIQQPDQIIEQGPLLSIRHPEWTEEVPRQDIPIIIFTIEQWASLQQEEFHIGAAPIGPSLLGQNNQYVFALPARYNFAFPKGVEEVEEILENKPLQPFNVEK